MTDTTPFDILGKAIESQPAGMRSISFPPLIEDEVRSIEIEESLPPQQQWTIFKVPAHIREDSERAYSPKFVSIGPFHYKKPGLEAMEAQKLQFLSRNGRQNLLAYLKIEMSSLQVTARKCYSADFQDITDDDFAGMMAVDGCFVVDLLRLAGKRYQGEPADDPIFATRSMPVNLARDLLLVENQLPLFVLQKLFESTSTSGQEQTSSLSKLALQFFEPLRPGKDVIVDPIETESSTCPHLLALFHTSFDPTNRNPSPAAREETSNGDQTALQLPDLSPPAQRETSNGVSSSDRTRPAPAEGEISTRYRTFVGRGWVYNATKLSVFGVEFSTKSGNIMDVEFRKRGTIYADLKIPIFFMDEATTCVVRNLVAYEQYNRHAMAYYTSLAVLFNNLVETPGDVRVLKRSGILRQAQGGSEQVINFFDSLTKELVFDMDKSCFQRMIEDIRNYCQNPRAKTAAFVRSAWSNINFVGLLVLYISIIQTVLYQNIPNTNGTSTAPSPSPSPSPSPAPSHST